MALRELRAARRWSQARLMLALAEQAAAEGCAVPGRDSLRVMVSRWENGRVAPDENYRRYLRAIFGCGDNDLGFAAPAALPGTGLPMVQLPERVTPPLLDYLRSSLMQYVMADNMLGAGAIVSVVEQQSRMIDALVDGRAGAPQGGQRRALLDLACRYAELSGWLRQDAGDAAAAQRWSDSALAYAHEIGDDQRVAYVLMRKSNIAADAEQTDRATDLAEASLRSPALLAPRMHAVALRQQAIAYSLAGREADTARALDLAGERVTEAMPETADAVDSMDYCTSAYIASEAGACWLRLGRPVKAAGILEESIASWPESLRRDKGLLLARLARARVATGDIDEAAACAVEAGAVARTTASSRTVAELRLVRASLGPWWKLPSVRAADDELARLW